ATACPSKRCSPELGRSRQPRIDRSVVLPEPLGPMIATFSPERISRLTPASASTCVAPRGYARTTSRSATSGLPCSGGCGAPPRPPSGAWGNARVRGAAAGVAQQHALAARDALLDHHEVGVRGPEHDLARAGRAPGQEDDAAPVALENRVERHVERLLALLDLDLDARGHAGPQARLALADRDAHREELGPAPLLLLLRQRSHERHAAREPQVRA